MFPSSFPLCVEVDEESRRSVSGGVLILRDVEFADTAVYQCEATNKHGSILINTYLYVIGTSALVPPSSSEAVWVCDASPGRQNINSTYIKQDSATKYLTQLNNNQLL